MTDTAAIVDWDFHHAIFRKKLTDGSVANGPLMRRQVEGEWQYRRCTADEEADYLSRVAW